MSGNGNQVPLAPSQRGPGPYPRASTPHRPECYHPTGATGGAYMPSTAGGAQASAQSALRVQPAPQPSAPPAPQQQDMSKTTMAGHNYVSQQQNQSAQARPQYPNFQYRAAQHGARPNTHPRQQQPFITGATASAPGPVMYHPAFVVPTHMGIPPSYQQNRSNTPGTYYQYMPYLSYSGVQPSHTPQYYYPSNNQQIPTQNIPSNPQSGRTSTTTMVGPQGTPATPTAPTASIPQQQAPAHIHQVMPGVRPVQPKRSRRVPIIDPVTQQDIFSEFYSNDNQYGSDSSERQTPQSESAHSIAEEFTRMVNEVAKEPATTSESVTKYGTKNLDMAIPPTTIIIQPQPNAITSINNNIVKSEILPVSESKNLGPDVVVESNETPVVSAISDSPVIVPKMHTNAKQLQKNSEQNLQSVVLDKNIPPKKTQKSNKNKPVVPQVDEIEKVTEVSSVSHSNPAINTVVNTPVSGTTLTAVTQEPFVVHKHATTVPQPQRIREPRDRGKSEDKEKDKESQNKECPPVDSKLNGPTHPVVISSVDSLPETISQPTSQSNPISSTESTKKLKPIKELSPAPEIETTVNLETNIEQVESESKLLGRTTQQQLLEAGIEKVAIKELPRVPEPTESKESSSAIQAQAKLTQSLASCFRTNQPDSKMKDINLNNKTTDPDTANGNTTEVAKTETVDEDVNRNEKIVRNTKHSNKNKTNKMANVEENVKEVDSIENGKDETDKINNVEKEEEIIESNKIEEMVETEKQEAPAASAVFVPKYNYNPGQWSPLNMTGKKCYDIGLLKQMKDDPLSKNKPDVPLLEAWNVIRTAPMQESLPFAAISRPMNDSLFPQFAKGSGMGARSNAPRDPKKDGRNMVPGKGSAKLPLAPSSGMQHKPVIHVSLSLREEVKLNETKNPWKPIRFKKENVDEEEFKTQELYKKFRGILNKLTPQKFDTLLEKIKTLEIHNQKRLEGVIDLVFEKAIDEPNFSEAYAAMCNKLSMLKVPADNATSPDQCVNFRALIISRCQNQFVTAKVDEQVTHLEKELAECTDPAKKKDLHAQLVEENRRIRMRSVGNVRFIGELYKLKMLTSKIMVYCMNYLIDKLEEEKLECLCKLLTTIGEQVESEVKEPLDNVFKKMQDIVERNKHKISSRVRFMIQDVIELRRRRWVGKSVVDSQPKMMDQIQKEAEQHQRHIELMNANPSSGFRRDEGGRGKRGDGRRQNSNSFMDSNNWKTQRPQNYTVDTSKLKAVTQKSLSNIKLAPQNPGWNLGSSTKTTTAVQLGSNPMISFSKNKYSVLENDTDPSITDPNFTGNKDTSSYHSKGASIERSTFNSKGDYNTGSGGKSGSIGVARSNSNSRSTSVALPAPLTDTAASAPTPVPQERLPDAKKKTVKSIIDLSLINPNDDEVVAEVKSLLPAKYHADVVTEILNVVLEKAAKEVAMVAKSMFHLVSTNTIAPENFLAGLKEIFEFAPDLHIDIPMLYEYLGKFIAPLIEKKHITLVQILELSETIISSNHGQLLLKAIIKEMKDSMGPSFVANKWQDSGLRLNQWMSEDQVAKWIEDNKFEFLEGAKTYEETKKILTPTETQSKLLQLMNTDENCDCIKGWVQDNLGKSSNEEWFMRALIQAICEYALFGPEARDVPHFNQERMNKYSRLITEFGDSQQAREASCLVGIQQLIHRLEHPQGLSLEIFQYLNEQYIISPEGFIAWEESELEPEGRGVMMKALTSFFTNIKEADNEDSCSED